MLFNWWGDDRSIDRVLWGVLRIESGVMIALSDTWSNQSESTQRAVVINLRRISFLATTIDGAACRYVQCNAAMWAVGGGEEEKEAVLAGGGRNVQCGECTYVLRCSRFYIADDDYRGNFNGLSIERSTLSNSFEYDSRQTMKCVARLVATSSSASLAISEHTHKWIEFAIN